MVLDTGTYLVAEVVETLLLKGSLGHSGDLYTSISHNSLNTAPDRYLPE